jgi:hypothetical protein
MSRFQGVFDWIYCTLYIHTTQDYRQYSAIAILHTLQFTIPHALGFCPLLTVQFPSCHYSAAANSEDSSQFNFSAPKLISRQAGVPKLDSSLLDY